MSTKVKGMTSVELAILVAIVLAIAIAVGWYLYTTFGASVTAQPNIRIVSALAYRNGTIVIEAINAGSAKTAVVRVEVFGNLYGVPGGYVNLPPMGSAVIRINTGVQMRTGGIVQGRLITEDGHSIPFSAKVI